MAATVTVKPAERKIVITENGVNNELFVPLEVQEVYAALKVLEAAGFSLTTVTVDKILDWAIRFRQAKAGI